MISFLQALGIVMAVAAAFIAFAFRRYRQGYSVDDSTEILFFCLVFGVVGGRCFWVLQNWHEYRRYVPYVFRMRDGGFGIIGIVLADMAFTGLYLKKNNMSVFRCWDALLPGMLLMSAVARVSKAVNNQMRLVVVLDLLGFLLTYFVLGHQRRGDAAAYSLMWMGVERIVSCLNSLDPDANNILVPAILLEGIGIVLWILLFFRRRQRPVILFDLDGTLMNSLPVVTECYRYLFKKYGNINDFTDMVQMEVFGPPLEVEIKKLFPDFDTDELVEDYRQYQVSHDWTGVAELFPGAEDLLKDLKERGFTLGIVSSRVTASCRDWLNFFNIKKYFSLVLGGDRIGKPKPEPDGILLACEKLGKGHDSCIYVGDNGSDVIAAKRAGVYAIGFVSEPKKEVELMEAKPNSLIYQLKDISVILRAKHEWTYEMR